MTSTTTESHEEYVNSPVLLSTRILTRWLVYNDEQCVKTPINVLCYPGLMQTAANRKVYKRTHFLLFTGSGGSNAARIASSKTFFNPFCVNAEHSTYLTAFSSFASFSPCSNVIGFCLFLASFSMVAASSRKSICVPTNKNGVF